MKNCIMGILLPCPIMVNFCDLSFCRKLDSILSLFGDNKPDIIAYNAGTDCMINDPLGLLRISEQVCNKYYNKMIKFSPIFKTKICP